MSAVLGFTLISWEFIISTRIGFIEKLFGGLDKAYRSHHIIGGLGYIFILLHPSFLIIDSLPNTELALFYIVPFKTLEYTLGMFALYSFTVLILITLFLKIPYHLWKRTHIFMGVPLIFAILHVALVKSDKNTYLPLQLWLMMFSTLAFAGFIYKRVFYEYFRKTYEYKVEKLNQLGEVTEIYLAPLKKKLNFEPGQFAFLKFQSKNVSSEEHPFSISSNPKEPYLRFSIKNLGDFTATLKDLQIGDKVSIKGPYGVFGEKLLQSAKPQIWIAGGIGVTPFLSMLSYTKSENLDRQISLFYSTRNNNDNYYGKEINKENLQFDGEVENRKQKTENREGHDELDLTQSNHELRITNDTSQAADIKIVGHHSDSMGYINSEFVEKNSLSDLKKSRILLCGPKIMMKSLERQFLDLGIKPYNIIYEEFSLR